MAAPAFILDDQQGTRCGHCGAKAFQATRCGRCDSALRKIIDVCPNGCVPAVPSAPEPEWHLFRLSATKVSLLAFPLLLTAAVHVGIPAASRGQLAWCWLAAIVLAVIREAVRIGSAP